MVSWKASAHCRSRAKTLILKSSSLCFWMAPPTAPFCLPASEDAVVEQSDIAEDIGESGTDDIASLELADIAGEAGVGGCSLMLLSDIEEAVGDGGAAEGAVTSALNPPPHNSVKLCARDSSSWDRCS